MVSNPGSFQSLYSFCRCPNSQSYRSHHYVQMRSLAGEALHGFEFLNRYFCKFIGSESIDVVSAPSAAGVTN